MSYTPEQAVAVAMFNAGIKDPPDARLGIPTRLAREVVRHLRSMGWDLDGTRHEQMGKTAAAETPQFLVWTEHPPRRRRRYDERARARERIAVRRP